MMSFASLEDIIPKILQYVNFEEYLLENKYKLLPNKDIKGFKCFTKKNKVLEDDVVFIGNYKGKEIFYSLLFNDFGNIIDFVKNRIEFDNSYETFEPNKDHLIEACKKLVSYINEVGENITKIKIETSDDDLNNLKKNTFTKYFKAEPIFDTKYLESFNISKEIINHPIFEGTIYNTRGLIYNEEQLDIINTVYPLYNESGKECGLFFENYIEKNKQIVDVIDFFAAGSIQSGLWFSNNFLLDKKIKTKLTIVNSPKDALAHFSHLKENRYYVATFKEDETTYTHIKALLNRQKNTSLHLAGNVTIANFIDEIKIIIEILDRDIYFIKENYDHIILKIKVENNNENDLTKFFKYIRNNNALKLNDVIKKLGEDSKQHLKNDLIMLVEDTDGNISVKVPKNFKTLYHFEQMLIKAFPAPYDIVIEKPTCLNWTKQNIVYKKALNDKENEDDVIQKYIEEEKIFVLSN